MMSDDRDLEDFFARKAKKKTKGKFTTSSKIAQNVEYLQTAEREREQAHLQPAPEKPALPNPVSRWGPTILAGSKHVVPQVEYHHVVTLICLSVSKNCSAISFHKDAF